MPIPIWVEVHRVGDAASSSSLLFFPRTAIKSDRLSDFLQYLDTLPEKKLSYMFREKFKNKCIENPRVWEGVLLPLLPVVTQIQVFQ